MNGALLERLGLTLAAAALIAYAGWQTDGGQTWSAPPGDAPAPGTPFVAPALAEEFELPPADRFMDIALRTIFLPTRAPVPEAPATPPEPPKPNMAKGQFVLTGMSAAGDLKFAYLLEKSGNKSRVVREGETINGILVREVATTHVILAQHDDSETLELRVSKAPVAASAKGAGAPAPAPVPGAAALSDKAAAAVAAPSASSTPAPASETPRRRRLPWPGGYPGEQPAPNASQ